MKRSRFSETQIMGILKEAEAGMPVKEVCRKHGISSPDPARDFCTSESERESHGGGQDRC